LGLLTFNPRPDRSGPHSPEIARRPGC